MSAISDFSLSLSLSLFVLVCLMCRFHTIFCYSCFQTTLWHSMNICYPMFWKQFPHFALKTTAEFLFILSCCGNARNTHKLRRITIHLAIGKKYAHEWKHHKSLSFLYIFFVKIFVRRLFTSLYFVKWYLMRDAITSHSNWCCASVASFSLLRCGLFVCFDSFAFINFFLSRQKK